MREVREILRDINADVLSMKEAGIDADIVEEGCLLHETGINSKSSPFRAFKSLTGHKHAVDCQYLFQPGSGCIISVNYLFDACHQSSSMISHHPWVSGASPYWMSCSAW